MALSQLVAPAKESLGDAAADALARAARSARRVAAT
jgi:flavin-binding protein dodecin